MASFRTRYDDHTFYSIMAFVSFSPNITHSIYSLPYFVFVVFRFPLLFIIDEHYLRAIKTRYLWQTRVHIQPLPSPPTKNDLAMNIFVMARTIFSYFWQYIWFSLVFRGSMNIRKQKRVENVDVLAHFMAHIGYEVTRTGLWIVFSVVNVGVNGIIQ